MGWPAHTCCCSSCEFTLHKAALRKFTRAEKRGSPLESPLEPVKKRPHEGAWTTVPSGPNRMAAIQGQKLGANPQRNSSAHHSADTIALAAEWEAERGALEASRPGLQAGALPPISCVASGKLLHLSETASLPVSRRWLIVPSL